ncbi:AAA family ATPase [Cyanobium gracile]|uniref:AAA family ATPase n=1 Tax=Cyanobium gracile UHCC 0281 TaxID=3110309 RepID=A0ABU5SUC2_9CYAN|nr:AAA family ATPase [Cyanobium gracile]MEA5442093.1 AAA family ATPase [Cyanobium gracile UHCC 0281]
MSKIKTLLSENNDIPATIPFAFHEGGALFSKEKNIGEATFVEQRFRQSFHCQDLFCYRNPLKDDSLFYGRTSILAECVGRHRAGENTGVFGLRKSGKTSVLYALQRQLDNNESLSILVDCNRFGLNRWNQVLGHIIKEYKRKLGSKVRVAAEEIEYDPKNAQQLFTDDFFRVYESKKSRKALLMFDEIERMTPETGTGSWRSDDDFIHFWHAIRNLTQLHTDKCTYLISGTNPCALESTYWFNRLENPIFQHAKPIYLPSFGFEEMKKMLNEIGFYMGLEFKDDAIYYLLQKFGGHPFLTRQACSGLNKLLSDQSKPILIDNLTWSKHIESSLHHISSYLKLIVDALRFFPDEYEMLKIMVTEGSETFEEYAVNNRELIHHLEGYGIISKTPLGYEIAIDCIRDHLSSKWKYSKRGVSQEEKELELSGRRNRLERNIRKLIKRSLKQSARNRKCNNGDESAMPIDEFCLNRVYRSLTEDRRTRLMNKDYSFDDLLGGQSPLFLLELSSIISKNWVEGFSSFFGEHQKERVRLYLGDINSTEGGGRNDCHAKDISDSDFESVRTKFTYFEELLEDE